MLDWFLFNIPFFIFLIYFILKMIFAPKKGAVKELCGFVSIIIASLVVLLIGFGIRKYLAQDRVIFVITIILLFLLVLIYKLFDFLFTTLKIIANLPGVNIVNKILGVPVAILITLMVLWTIFCIAMVFDEGAFAVWTINCVKNNGLMRFLYEHNYLYLIVSKFSKTLSAVDFWGILGM